MVDGCGGKHHISVHDEAETSQREGGQARVGYDDETEATDAGDGSSEEDVHAYEVRPQSAAAAAGKGRTRTSFVSLAFVPVKLRNPENGREVHVSALLDLGADGCLLLKRTAEELGCRGEPMQYQIKGFGDNVQHHSDVLSLKVEVRSVDGLCVRKIAVKTLPDLCGSLRPTDWNQHLKNWPHLAGIRAMPEFERLRVDLILGMDQVDLCNPSLSLGGGPGEPIFWQTRLGQTIYGPTDQAALQKKNRAAFACGLFYKTRALPYQTKPDWLRHAEACGGCLPVWEDRVQVWAEEKWAEKPALTKAEEAAVKVFYESRQKKGEMYEVSPLWKQDPKGLPNNVTFAETRLENLGKQLKKHPDRVRQYEEVIEGWLERGYIEPVQEWNRKGFTCPTFL